MGAPNLPAAFFVSSDLNERDVTLGDGSVHKMLFREASARVFRRYYLAAARVGESGTEDEDFDRAVSDLISASVANSDGTPALTSEQASTLRFEVQASIVKAIREGQKADPGKT